jgi:hypothetical protein
MVAGNQVDFKEIFKRIDRAPNLPVGRMNQSQKIRIDYFTNPSQTIN